MSIIKVENLTFAYPSSFDNIFENVNFQIDTDWKLGFIGRNGRGKQLFSIFYRVNMNTAEKSFHLYASIIFHTKYARKTG